MARLHRRIERGETFLEGNSLSAVRRACRDHDVTLEQLAVRAGTSRFRLVNMLSGHDPVTARALRILEAFVEQSDDPPPEIPEAAPQATARPEAAKSQAARPEAAKPQAAKPQAAKPQAAKSQAAAPAEPEATPGEATPKGPRKPARRELAPEEQQKVALDLLAKTWKNAQTRGVSGEILATALIYAALGEMVGTHGEEPVAQMLADLPERVRAGEFTMAPEGEGGG